MKRILVAAMVVLGMGAFQACSCDNNGMMGDGGNGDDGGMAEDLSGTVSPSSDGGCTASGQAGVSSSECCSGSCNGKVCVTAMCGGDGASCKLATDCCKLNCANGTCATAQCISDGQACSAGGAACCSTQCVNGTCKPLSTTCKTAGNSCTTGGECCGKVCTGGLCAAPSSVSYCTQPGDICYFDNDC